MVDRTHVQEERAKPEFSRTIPVDRLRRGALKDHIEATEAERRRLAERFELEDIGILKADVLLEPMKNGMVRVSGNFVAAVVQTCVVSLESVPAALSEPFAALFAPPEMIDEDEMEIDIEALLHDEEDPPEAIVDHRIDIGELVAQHLSLSLDPYPRAKGVDFEDIREHDDPDEDAGIDLLGAPDAPANGDDVVGEAAEGEGGGGGPRQRPFAEVLAKLKRDE